MGCVANEEANLAKGLGKRMVEISVDKAGGDSGERFRVTVKEGSSQSQQEVSLTDAYYQKLMQGNASKEDCIQGAFRFLLERESKESILREFDLTVIQSYFGDFEKKCQKYIKN